MEGGSFWQLRLQIGGLRFAGSWGRRFSDFWGLPFWISWGCDFQVPRNGVVAAQIFRCTVF